MGPSKEEDPRRVALRREVLALALGKRKRGTKYRSQPRRYNGILYASRAEAARAEELDLLVAAGELVWWIRQPTLYLGCAENVYRPDFLVIPVKGRPFFEDVKGVETQKFARDKKLWRSYGRLELRIIKGGSVVEIIDPMEGNP
jgi:hypothetical protein